MDAPPIKLVVIADRTLELLDGILADLADAIESIRVASAQGVPANADLLDPMLSLTCRARAIVLEDRDTGAQAWDLIEQAAGRLS